MNLLITARRIATTARDAVRSVINPVGLVTDQAEPTVVTTVEAPEPAGLFTEDEMPPVKDIARAALSFDLAADNARRADRAKRAAKRILTRLPSGTYGAWEISRKPSARQTVDLAAVTAFYRQHGKTVPMKPCADSLVVERIEAPAPAELVAA